jgi:hypothetical protein
LSFRKEAKGEDVAARELQYRLLYGSAVELEEAIEAELVIDKSKHRAEGVLKGVVEHYWKNPATTSFLDKEEWLRVQMGERLDQLLQKYKPAEQGGDDQPAAAMESKAE